MVKMMLLVLLGLTGMVLASPGTASEYCDSVAGAATPYASSPLWPDAATPSGLVKNWLRCIGLGVC